jgi:hypothetical protein
MFAAHQAGLVQAAGNVLHQAGQLRPGHGLPDAVFLLAHGGRRGAVLRVLREQLGKGCLHGAQNHSFVID